MAISILLFIFYLAPRILFYLDLPKSEKLLFFLLTLILIVNVALVGARLGDPAQTNWQFFSLVNRVLAGLALILSFSFFAKKLPDFVSKYRLWVLVIIAVLIRIFAVISAPNPSTDVFYILRDGPKLLMQGMSPYKLSYPAPYGTYIPTIIFHYGPLTPFIFIPAVLFFNDPRFTLVAIELLTALVIYKIGEDSKVNKNFIRLSIAIFLFHPLFPFMTEHAWPEPVITFLLFLAVYLINKYPRNIAGSSALGAILAIKSVYILPLITYLFSQKAKLKHYLITISIPIVLSLPFLISDHKLFLERTQIYVTNPEKIAENLAPTNISLSISAVILKYTGVILPSAFVALFGLIAAVAVILKKYQEPSMSVLSIFLVFITLFMFGPFVFVYNFTFLGNILLLSILLLLSRKPRSSEL